MLPILSLPVAAPVRSIRRFAWLGLVCLGLALLLAGCASDYGYSGSYGNPLSDMESSLRCVFVVIGLLLLLAGFALHQFIIQVIGFVAGGLIGGLIGALLAGRADTLSIIAGFIIVGLVGAALAKALAGLIIFLSGFFAGAFLFAGMGAWLTGSRDPSIILGIIGGVIGGIVMIVVYRFWITLFTAILGAVLAGLGLGLNPLVWVLLFVVGMAVQYGIAKVAGKSERVKPGYQTQPKPVPAAQPAYGAVQPPAAPPAVPPAVPPPVTEKICRNCGHRILAGASVCPYCNQPQ